MSFAENPVPMALGPFRWVPRAIGEGGLDEISIALILQDDEVWYWRRTKRRQIGEECRR